MADQGVDSSGNGRQRRRSTVSNLSNNIRRSIVIMDERIHGTFMSTIALCSAVLSMFYSLMNVFPYSGFMAMQLIPSLTRESAGKYAGMLASSFMVGRALSSFTWGHVADIYGRKFVLLFSLWSTIVFSLLFGLSPSFGWAMATRFLMGLGNGTMIVARTLISELSYGDKDKEAKSMGVLMSMVGYGMLIGPALGGTLSEPTKQYPKLLNNLLSQELSRFLQTYPFILPNVVTCIISLCSVVLVMLCVKETLSEEKRRGLQHILPDSLSCIFQTPLKIVCGGSTKNSHQKYSSLSQEEEDEFMILDHSDSTELSALLSSKASRKSYSAAMHRPSLIQRRPTEEKPATISSLMSNVVTRKHLMAYWSSGFASVAQTEAFPLFAMAKIGGLGLSESEIGAIGTGSGLLFCIFQYVVFSSMTKRYGLHRAMVYGSFWSNAPIVLFPVSLLLPYGVALIFLSILSAVTMIFNSVFYAGITVATNRTVSASNRAKLNGLSSLGASVGRGLGPLVAGLLVAISFSNYLPISAKIGSILIYSVLTALAMMAFYVTYNLPEEIVPSDSPADTITDDLSVEKIETLALEKVCDEAEV